MRAETWMRVVPDTNTVVSGLLWHGPPRQVLDAARSRAIQPYTTAGLLALGEHRGMRIITPATLLRITRA